ncbi:LPS assembly protein LptD [Marivita sp. XM-24bin2]|jgi:LPS-assembly protein|uniref:LPS-assembly protein LptD n=1 Tax=unclassified Marivita TaxID=2632480 RepID=UPI000D7B4575|nr:LPS assembly protein LptD [Marivita sp. XM-24bin2]MCR9108685.1 LPS assembly protein LptD [Paracoccaceae bacterium]PWL34159.1 MAG: LPS-assembly protein LptD [Marivita sp. XM-24bin2]
MLRVLIAGVMALTFAAVSARAQSGDVILLADQVLVEQGGDTLVATGNVEALHEGTRLTASSIIYDRTSDSLQIQGPIRITQPNGDVLTATQADLDQGFENGLLESARFVLDEQLQIAAARAARVQGRYTAMSQVAATSCQVCGSDRPPLWAIRATRVVHDANERQIYFDNAQLRVLGVPVFYIPRMRLPDPTLERARGFLIPELKTSSLLGFGIKLPYFIPLGDHADLTLTPYVSPVTRTLELRYRQAFRTGDITVNGAISRDSLDSGVARGLFFAEGAFRLPRGFRLSFDIEAVSDEAYLNDYNSEFKKDRLDSALTLARTQRDSFFSLGLIHYESLTDGENNATQPTIIGDLRYNRRFFPKPLGGEVRLGFQLHGHYRYSDTDIDGGDADSVVDGRDVARANLDLSWRDRWTLPGGIRAGVLAQLWADHFIVEQDAEAAGDFTEVTPAASVELRWPWIKRTANGGRVMVEPLAQVGWIGGARSGVPNDESTRVEFDEGNLLSLSRFPAPDRRERGLIGAAGLRWMREDPEGWRAAFTLGRVWRDEVDTAFSRSSGQDSAASDWLIAGQFSHRTGIQLLARGLYDSDMTRFTKAEMRTNLTKERYSLGASYILLTTDRKEDRDDAQSQWRLNGRYNIDRNWTATGSTRYDIAEGQFLKAGVGAEYRNECVSVDFSVSRNFASSTNLEPSTDFGLTVALTGFSTGGSGKEYRRSCSY